MALAGAWSREDFALARVQQDILSGIFYPYRLTEVVNYLGLPTRVGGVDRSETILKLTEYNQRCDYHCNHQDAKPDLE
jgi:hypothetical protein